MQIGLRKCIDQKLHVLVLLPRAHIKEERSLQAVACAHCGNRCDGRWMKYILDSLAGPLAFAKSGRPVDASDFKCGERADGENRFRAFDGACHLHAVGHALEKRCISRMAVQDQIVNRRDKGNRTQKRNIEVRREEKIDAAVSDRSWKEELLSQGIVSIICNVQSAMVDTLEPRFLFATDKRTYSKGSFLFRSSVTIERV